MCYTKVKGVLILFISYKMSYFCINKLLFMEETKAEQEELILIRITGQDRPGLTTAVMSILAHYNAHVLDIWSSRYPFHIVTRYSYFVLMKKGAGQVMKELLFKATELGVNIGFSPVADDEYEDWVNEQGKNRYILTIIGRSLSARNIEGANTCDYRAGSEY